MQAARRFFRAFMIVSTVTLAGGAPEQVQGAPAPSSGWRFLPPIADPVGYAGMFAGVVGGRLIAGGGSQFRDKPVWLGGQKTYTDRVFALDASSDRWRELTARLPEAGCFFAHAAAQDAIYLAGGMGASGSLRTSYELRKRGDELVFSRLPDLPRPLSHAAAAVIGGKFYVAGGTNDSAGRTATAETWSLDLTTAGNRARTWQREADLPGPAVFVPTGATFGRHFYVLGGMAFSADGQYRPSAAARRFDTATRSWQTVRELPAPRVGAASPCAVTSQGRILVIGGYAEVYPGAMRDHPGFSRQTFMYDIAGDEWELGPVLPERSVVDRDSPGDAGVGPMLGAPGAIWENMAVVIGGESRGSARTPAVIAWPLSNGDARTRNSRDGL